MAGSATFNTTTHVLTLTWTFPDNATALRVIEETLREQGQTADQIAALTPAQKATAFRQAVARWAKASVATFERRDADATAASAVETQIDLS